MTNIIKLLKWTGESGGIKFLPCTWPNLAGALAFHFESLVCLADNFSNSLSNIWRHTRINYLINFIKSYCKSWLVGP